MSHKEQSRIDWADADHDDPPAKPRKTPVALVIFLIGLLFGCGLTTAVTNLLTPDPAPITVTSDDPGQTILYMQNDRPLRFNPNAGYPQTVEVVGVRPHELGFEFHNGHNITHRKPCNNTSHCMWMAPAVPSHESLHIIYNVGGTWYSVATNPNNEYITIHHQP